MDHVMRWLVSLFMALIRLQFVNFQVFKTSSKVFVSKLQKLSKNNLASQLMCQFLDRSNKFH